MTAPRASLEELLKVSAALDARFHILRGDSVVTNKERDFKDLFQILEESGIGYALIGGLAVQLWRSEPRTTLDIDVAVRSYEDIPRGALEAAGFRLLAQHPHSQNWKGPDNTPVQFSADPEFASVIETSVSRNLDAGRVRIASPAALVREKLRAAADPARRESKRFQDLADAKSLVEEHPETEAALTDPERTLLRRPL